MQLTENEIKNLCVKSREIFLSQPVLLELEAPLKICGKFFTSCNLSVLYGLCCYIINNNKKCESIAIRSKIFERTLRLKA